MRKDALNMAVRTAEEQTRAALQLVYDSLNQGQKKKLQKEDKVAELLARFEVEL